MGSQTVLITGANGHIGFRVVVLALEAGYKVRAVVRNQEKADRVSSAESIKAVNPKDRLTFSFVPDLLKPGAYDEAIEGVDYAIHIASPITANIPEDKYESDLLKPAVTGTLAILKAAQNAPTVKRIVITSSVVGSVSWPGFFLAESDTVFDEKSRTPDPQPPFSNEFEAYAASKVWAINATEKLVEQEKPKFDVVHVHPAFVLGKDEMVTGLEDFLRGTNKTALGAVVGQTSPFPLPGTSVDLEDVAIAHVKALDSSIPGGQSLMLASEGIKGTQWNDAIDIVSRRFPKAVEAGVLPNNGSSPTKPIKIDASVTEKLLGIKFRSFEEQVVSVVGHYLKLNGVEAA